MKVIMTKKDLIDSLAKFDDNDAVVIEVHDMVATEDLYTFYVDPIDMELDADGNHRGFEIRLSVLPHVERWYEVYVSLGEDEGTMTVKSFDNAYQLFLWYAKLPTEGIVFEDTSDMDFNKSDISVDSWFRRLPDGQNEKSHTLI
jgi:hypothetical protein